MQLELIIASYPLTRAAPLDKTKQCSEVMQKHENDGGNVVSCLSTQAHEQNAFGLFICC